MNLNPLNYPTLYQLNQFKREVEIATGDTLGSIPASDHYQSFQFIVNSPYGNFRLNLFQVKITKNKDYIWIRSKQKWQVFFKEGQQEIACEPGTKLVIVPKEKYGAMCRKLDGLDTCDEIMKITKQNIIIKGQGQTLEKALFHLAWNPYKIDKEKFDDLANF